MQIEISYRDLARTDAVDAFVEEKVHQMLGSYETRLTRVEVHLGDHNGDKGGGDDLRCMMEARPKGMRPIVVEAHGEKLPAVIAAAAEKLGRTIGRRIEKQRDVARAA